MTKQPAEPGPPPPAGRQRRSRKRTDGLVKLADVALRAGVSTATASRAINMPSLVSATTRARVDAAIRELKWIPHGAAKALASLRTRTIGVLVPTFGHQTTAAMIEAMQHDLAKADYTLLIGWPDPTLETNAKQAFNMIQRGVECLILVGEDQPDALMRLLDDRGIFYVIAYTSGRQGRKNCIGFDNYLEMSKMTEYLLELGHRDFGLVTRGYSRNDRIRQRIEGVRDTLARQGIAIRPQHFVEVPHFLIGSGREGMQRILAQPPMPTRGRLRQRLPGGGRDDRGEGRGPHRRPRRPQHRRLRRRRTGQPDGPAADHRPRPGARGGTRHRPLRAGLAGIRGTPRCHRGSRRNS